MCVSGLLTKFDGVEILDTPTADQIEADDGAVADCVDDEEEEETEPEQLRGTHETA